MITDKQIIDFYKAEGENHLHYQCQVFSKEASKKRFETVCSLIDPFAIEGLSLLEIGCAEGLYIDYFMDRGGDSAVGIDISEAKIKRAKKRGGVKYHIDLIENLLNLVEPGEADVILATEVIEHLRDPKSVIESCFKIGQYLVATVPIAEDLNPNPMKIQGHIHAFRFESFLDLFRDYNIVTADHSSLYAYAVVKR
jgi:2-polyprenyl-3-methyl-5-hydroxy-6-metoxy-1,4-benzoquinol methylase